MTRNVLSWLEEAARTFPNAIALEDSGGGLTYCQLRSRARAIGSFLARRYPAQSPVLLMMEKSPMTVAAMLGCVYAGCFYTPGDSSMPAARMARIVSRLCPVCILYDEKCAALRQDWAIPGHCLTEIGAETDQALLEERSAGHIDSDLLYVLFTSGSTGEPKGVAISHRSVIDFVDWAVEALMLPQGVSFGNQAPLYFDNSVLDLYCAMRMGGRVFFLSKTDFMFPKRMLQSLCEHRIDTIFWVPSALTAVAASGLLAKQPPELKRVFFCGEVMPCKTLNAWRSSLPEADFVNMYGPTEITDVCTWYRVDRPFGDSDRLPIGYPCKNTRILLLDGEICVTGTCLASGYYGDPERTAEAFVPNPLRPGICEMIYRTGDLGEYNARGELMFLGRRDHQIKRSGYRIELGEIECAVGSLPGVKQVCCVYQQETGRIICVWAGEADPKQLRAALRGLLPRYMLPDCWLCVAALPKIGSGKVDRIGVRAMVDREYSV